MYIEGAPVYHMIDDATHFSAAQFSKPLTAESFRDTILIFWAAVYTGLPNVLVFADSSQFRNTFLEICEINDVQ